MRVRSDGFQQDVGRTPMPKSETSTRLSRSRTGRVFLVWPGLFGVGLLSGLVSILYLTGSLFMLEVYDRVLPSHSIPTLVALGVLVLGLYAFQGLFDFLRSRLLVRIAIAVDGTLRRKTYEAVVNAPLALGLKRDGLQPLRDLDQIRAFLSGLGPAALFDLPWVPFYVVLCFVFHFWIGVTALAGAALLALLTIMTEFFTRRPTRLSAQAATQSIALANACQQNAEVLRAMGMVGNMAESWEQNCGVHVQQQRRIADISGGFGSVTKVLRFALQSAVLGIGAYLVILGEATGGIMIASSILLARALAPIELAIGHWKGFVAARQSWTRLRALLARLPGKALSINLPAPCRSLVVEGLGLVAPSGNRLLIQDLSFGISAGQVIAVVGPSGSGKSSLARALVGVWQPIRGRIKLDGASLDQWSSDRLGRHVGYLPQDVELFEGTAAQNIARFSPDASSDSVIEAARAAGVHELICSLPQGYDTPLGEGGAALSAGQRQRVALARALYGEPFLIVLDEPNSNLDMEGEAALLTAIRSARDRGSAVVITAHRRSILAAVDQILVLADGRMRGLGSKDQVLQALKPTSDPDGKVLAPPQSSEAPHEKRTNATLRVVADSEGAGR